MSIKVLEFYIVLVLRGKMPTLLTLCVYTELNATVSYRFGLVRGSNTEYLAPKL